MAKALRLWNYASIISIAFAFMGAADLNRWGHPIWGLVAAGFGGVAISWHDMIQAKVAQRGLEAEQ